MKDIKVGTIVLAGNGLGVVQRVGKLHRAEGAWVLSSEYNAGTLTQFTQDFCLKPAIVGDTVCTEPRGTHSCGRTHVTVEDLAKLPRVGGAA